MATTHLCDSCRQINFRLLRLPVESEIPQIRSWNLPRDKFPYISDAKTRQTKINIGYLSDIKKRTKCELCVYIWELLSKLDVYTEDGKTRSGGRNVICRADVGRETAIFRYPEIDSNDSVTLYQLAFTTHLESHPHHDADNSAHLIIDNHFQTCNIGAGSIQIDDKFRDPRPGVDMVVFGGRRRPEQINLNWLRRWLYICEHEHGDLCNSMLSTPEIFNMPQVRFIEVVNKCVVTFRHTNLASIRYAALSYVWGKPPVPGSKHYNTPILQLDTSTITTLHQHESFRGEDVPQTIADMFDLAVALEIPYLWIDRLCIIQDSEEDKAAQVGNMHAIYNAALVTVVAAAGEDIYHGLPGLRPKTRQAKQKEIVVVEPCASNCREIHSHDREGLSLLSCLEPFFRGSHYLETTNWNRRGWTMQERILARRSLIFTKEQVRFSCSNATFSEEAYCEPPFPRLQVFSQTEADHGLRSSVRVFAESGDPETRLWGRLKTLVLRYSTRSLTFEGDVHDAFAAITQALAIEAKDEFLWGIPLSQFEIGLSWTTYDGQYRRKGLTTLPMTDKHRRVSIPSWSWMGWVGQTSIAVGRDRTETEKPTIECYVHSQKDRGIELTSIQHSTPASKSWKPRFFQTPWRFHDKRTVSLDDVKKHLSGFDFQMLFDIPASHVLFFWTSWATLRVSRSTSGHETHLIREPHRNFSCMYCHTAEQHLSGSAEPEQGDTAASPNSAPNILDLNGKVVGSLCRMKPEFWKDGSYDSGIHEFIVVGRRYVEELADFFPATLLVMQVERKDGIWYRINIGEISETDWDSAGGQWKLIVLG